LETYLVGHDPTEDYEIKNIRPCVVVSPNEINQNIQTVIIAPMTKQGRNYPTRVPVTFQGKPGEIVLDQLRTVDKSRLVKKLGKIEQNIGSQVLSVLVEMFSE